MKRVPSSNARTAGRGRILSLLWIVALHAQSISVTNPSAGAAVAGWTGFYFQVSLASAPSVAKVCYTVDAYAAYNPGIDGPTTLGCSIRPPFRYPYNSLWNLNGPHQVVATAYDTLGNTLATSAPVSFTTANNWPLSWSPSQTVTTSTATSSPWSGAVTVTATVSGAQAGIDQFSYHFFVDGFLQQTITSSSSSGQTGTIYTTQFPNGPRNVCVEINDNSAPSPYTGDVTWVAGVGEWCRTVTFSNGATPSQTILNGHEIFLAPGNTFTLTAQLLNTDGTMGSGSGAIFKMANPAQDKYIQGPGEGVTALSNLLPGVASVNSSGVVTANSIGAAIVNVMVPTITMTDLTVNGSVPAQSSSTTHAPTSAQTGWLLNVTGGSGCVPGVYQVTLVGANGFTTYNPIGSPGSVCTATIGPTTQAWVYVRAPGAPLNSSCYGQDGSIQSSYTSNCMFVSSLFSSLNVFQEEQPYNSVVPGCGAGLGARCDYAASGFNTFEGGALPPQLQNINGTESPSAWTSTVPSYIANLEVGVSSNSKFRLYLAGNSFANSTQNLWALTYGNESSPSYIGSTTALQYAVQQYVAQGNILGISWVDEISSHWGGNPLQGPLTLSNSGTTQSPLLSVTAVNSGQCAIALAPNPQLTLVGDQNFSITGSSISGMNNVPPAVHSIGAKASGAAASAVVSGGGSTITVTVTNGGSNIYIVPTVTLTGGGLNATYASATATIDTATGQVTGVTVTGASGYISAPAVVFTYYELNFACPGVTNGIYTASSDPGFTLQPYGDGWYASNTSMAFYDVWAKTRTQTNAIATGHFFFQAPGLGVDSAQSFANWGGSSTYPYTQAIGSVNSAFDGGDVYVPYGMNNFIQSRNAANTFLNTEMHGYWIRSLYGAIDPSKPYMEITEATKAYTGWQGYSAYCSNGTCTANVVVSCVGQTITLAYPHMISNIIPGITRIKVSGATDQPGAVDSCNGLFKIMAAPTPTTLTVVLAAMDFSQNTGGANNGGTITWPDTTTLSLSYLQAAGTVTGFGSNFNTAQQVGWMDGDLLGLLSWSAANYRHRGQLFTLSGVSTAGTANTPTAQCLSSGSCGWNHSTYGRTFELLPENINLASDPGAAYDLKLAYAEVPILNATGGTPTLLPDLNVRLGYSGQASLEAFNPGWVFASGAECLLTGCKGQRAYKPQLAPNGYSDQLGFIYQSYGTDPTSTTVSNQTYINEHFEDDFSRPGFEALSNIGLMGTRLAKYILQPSLSSPDYTRSIDCAARAGSYGDTMFCLNLTDGVQTETFSLAPYLQSGQQVIRYVVNDHSITAAVLTAGTASDLLTLQPEDAVFYVFPVQFAGELLQPAVAARLADVPNATKIAVRYAYDRYYLDSAFGNAFDCGTGACTPGWDRNIGPVYYRLIYLGPNSQVLAASDVQTF